MPSTAWKEVVGADEAARHAQAAKDIAEMQRRKNAKFGAGRALHRKGLLVSTGELEVAEGLPAHAAQGLFARPARYPVTLRLSNGGVDVQSNRRPDIRGFAFRVHGLPPLPAALGGKTEHQDFSLINQTSFAFADSVHFFGLVLAASHGPGSLLKWVFKTFGLMGGLKTIQRMGATFKRPFLGFAAQSFGSVLPIAFGPYAAKLRLKPINGAPMADGDTDWPADFQRQLKIEALRYELQAQFYESEAKTPIEDASQEWLEADAPFVTLARLTVNPPPADAQWQRQAEAGVFDPWQALTAHRPLGEVMRARKVVYFSSQQGRGAV
jgi:hypothetical protein